MNTVNWRVIILRSIGTLIMLIGVISFGELKRSGSDLTDSMELLLFYISAALFLAGIGFWAIPDTSSQQAQQPQQAHQSRFMGVDLGIGIMMGLIGTIVVLALVVYSFFKFAY